MGSFGFLLIIIAACAALYYFLFRPDVHLIMPDELKGIEKSVKELIEPDPMDHDFIVDGKDKLRKQYVQCAHFFERNPPGFSKSEAESLRSMVAETKQLLKDVCQRMESVKDPLENALSTAKDVVDKTKIAIKAHENSEETNDENEDSIDDLEGMLEVFEERVRSHTKTKEKLEYSLIKYRSL